MFALINFFLILLARTNPTQAYEPPVPLIQPLSPAGIRMSIPDEKGIRLVAFHVKINNDFKGLETGTINKDITQKTNGRWVYHDKSTKLKQGDIIYYWIHVIYNDLGYNLVDQKYAVEDFYDYSGNKIQPYVVPVPLIQPLSPRGFRMSIPDETGITLVAFHVKINTDFEGLEAGTIAKNIMETTDGRWVYQDKSTKLKKGDTLYYSIHVVHNNHGYNLMNQKYIVEDLNDYDGDKIQSSNKVGNTVAPNNNRPVNNCQTQCYVPPIPLIEPLTPVGIRMSIPDEEGISLVAFHVKFNEKFVGLQTGTLARDIVKAINGRWTYHDRTTQLKKGDVIHYWIHVIYKNLGYNLVKHKYTVTDFFDEEGNNVTESNDDDDDDDDDIVEDNTVTKSSTKSNDNKTTKANEKNGTKPDRTQNSMNNGKA